LANSSSTHDWARTKNSADNTVVLIPDKLEYGTSAELAGNRKPGKNSTLSLGRNGTIREYAEGCWVSAQ
jgi:hypothetical protein